MTIFTRPSKFSNSRAYCSICSIFFLFSVLFLENRTNTTKGPILVKFTLFRKFLATLFRRVNTFYDIFGVSQDILRDPWILVKFSLGVFFYKSGGLSLEGLTYLTTYKLCCIPRDRCNFSAHRSLVRLPFFPTFDVSEITLLSRLNFEAEISRPAIKRTLRKTRWNKT